MEIRTADYSVWEDEDSGTIFLEGTMRLSAYDAIRKVMVDRLAARPATLTLDLTRLEFLNSSGINLLAKFTIDVRLAPPSSFVVKGSKAIPWQTKSLSNLVKLYPRLDLRVE